MPHLTVEYSTNLKNHVDILKLVETVHEGVTAANPQLA